MERLGRSLSKPEPLKKRMTTYQELRHQVENSTLDEQLRLLEEIASILGRQVSPKPERSIMELEGLEKEIWQEVDAQDYVDQERASWSD